MSKKIDGAYLFSLASAFVLGVCLRLYLLKDQILIDDEWHGPLFIQYKSFFEVLTQINPSQNSSPLLNIYQFLCYHSIGLSEWNLRLPLLVTGCALPIIMPLLIRRILPDRAGIIFSFLLALSPFLVFYSRFARAYIIITLLSFLALLAAFQWMVTNKRAYAGVFIIASVAAVYTHPSAVAMTVAPYVALAFAFLIKRLDNRNSIVGHLAVPLKTSLKVMMVHAVCLFAVIFNYITNLRSLPLHVRAFSGSAILSTLPLIGGTASTAVLALFAALALFGWLRLYQINPFLALLLFAGVAVNVLFILFINPAGIETGAVILRYCIAIIPVILLCVAVGSHNLLDEVQKRIAPSLVRRVLPVVCICFGVLLLYLKGPLPVIYRAPNNFTSHLAFQGSYQYGDWQKSRSNHFCPSYEISSQDIPAFYKWLAADPASRAIIEYPFDFADHSNLFYFYQIHHRKRVLAGYCSNAQLWALSVSAGMRKRMNTENLVLAYSLPEVFFSSAAVKSRTHFRNMVDIADDREVLRSRADYLVLHKLIHSIYIKKEGTKETEMGNFLLFYESVNYFKGHFTRILGEPVYEDGDIIVFALTRR